MKTTIDAIEVPADVLEEAMRRAGTSEPRAAVLEALIQYTRPRNQKELVKYLGTSESFFTAEELERMRGMD